MLPLHWGLHLRELRYTHGPRPPLFVPKALLHLGFTLTQLTVGGCVRSCLVGEGFRRRQRGVELDIPSVLEYGVYDSWFLLRLTSLILPEGWMPSEFCVFREGILEDGEFLYDYFDKEMFSLYHSEDIVENFTNPQGLVVLRLMNPSAASSFCEPREPWVFRPPETPGYWKVRLPYETYGDRARHNCFSVLREKGFSHVFDPKDGMLYFSNTVGSRIGLPPSPRHLGIRSVRVLDTDSPWDYGCVGKGSGGPE
jgi:hypothetical protein